MVDQPTQTRDAALLGTACAAGIVVASQMPLVGVPLAGAAAAGLAYRGARVWALAALVAGIALSAALYPATALFAAAVALAAAVAIVGLETWSLEVVGVLCIGLLSLGAIGTDALSAHAAGTTLIGAVRSQANLSADALRSVLGASAEWTQQLKVAQAALVTLWPAFYAQTAVYATVFLVAAVAWSARRTNRQLNVPSNRDLDLTGHVLWGLVCGLVVLAAAPLFRAGAGTARAVALNLLFATRTLFFIQGVAVASAVFDVPRTGRFRMVVLYAGVWLFDQFLLIVSLIGMLDFWANFRRLPRDGSAPPARLEEPPYSV